MIICPRRRGRTRGVADQREEFVGRDSRRHTDKDGLPCEPSLRQFIRRRGAHPVRQRAAERRGDPRGFHHENVQLVVAPAHRCIRLLHYHDQLHSRASIPPSKRIPHVPTTSDANSLSHTLPGLRMENLCLGTTSYSYSTRGGARLSASSEQNIIIYVYIYPRPHTLPRPHSINSSPTAAPHVICLQGNTDPEPGFSYSDMQHSLAFTCMHWLGTICTDYL